MSFKTQADSNCVHRYFKHNVLKFKSQWFLVVKTSLLCVKYFVLLIFLQQYLMIHGQSF